MNYERMVEELMAQKWDVLYSNGLIIAILKDGSTVELNMDNEVDRQEFQDFYNINILGQNAAPIGDVTAQTQPTTVNTQQTVRPGPGTEQEKDRWAAMGWDFDQWGPLPSKPDPYTLGEDLIDEGAADKALQRLLEADPERVAINERERLATEGRTNLKLIQEQQDRLREQAEREEAAAFTPRFDVDQLDRTIVQMSPGGKWQVVEPEEPAKPLTKDEQLAKLVGEGRYDEAVKLDQIYDQLNTERLTPERAAEMLVDISYSPSDFKDMMDALMGDDSQLDITVDISALQEQASAMLRGDVPTILQGDLPVPPALAPADRTQALEPAPVLPIPQPRPTRAVDLEGISVAQAGNIPARENRLFQPSEEEEFAMGPVEAGQPAEPIFIPPSGQALSRNIAEIGASAAASARAATEERAIIDEEIRRIQNIPFSSTAAKLKAMEEVMGPRAALYMRNERLLGQKRQQLFESQGPLIRKYV